MSPKAARWWQNLRHTDVSNPSSENSLISWSAFAVDLRMIIMEIQPKMQKMLVGHTWPDRYN